MKGGADISDQREIRIVVENAHAAGEVVNVPALAASLNIPLDCCQSFVDFYQAKQAPIAAAAEVTEKPKKVKVKAPAEDEFSFPE